MSNNDFCIVIPIKNEEKTIGDILDRCLNLSSNILIVDGHSSDRSLEIVRDKRVPFVFDNNKGKGDALKVGVKNTKQKIIVFIDGDGSHEVEDIPKILEPIRKGEADLVVGSRMLGGSDELHGTFSKFIRNTGNNLLAVLINLKWKTDLTDIENGFRAIKREVFYALKLKSNGFTIEQEMILKCLKLGYRVREVASHEYERKFGNSKLKTSQGFLFLLHFFKEYFF